MVASSEKWLSALEDPTLSESEIDKIFLESDSKEVALKVFQHPNVSFLLFKKLFPFCDERVAENLKHYNAFMRESDNNTGFLNFCADFTYFNRLAVAKSWVYKAIYDTSERPLCLTTFVNSPYVLEHYSLDELSAWIQNLRLFEPRDLLALPNATEQALLKAIENNDLEDLAIIAPKPDLSPMLFERLAKHRNSDIRVRLAKNPNTPLNILQKLSKDKSANVSHEAKNHPTYLANAPQSKECDLDLNSKNRDTLIELLQKQVLTESEVEQLYRSTSRDIDKYFIVLHQAPSAMIVADMMTKDDWVKAALAYNQKTPISILQELSHLTHPDVQLALAQNANLPLEESLKILANPDQKLVHRLLANTQHQAVFDAVKKSTPSLQNIKGIYAILLDPTSKSALISQVLSQSPYAAYSDVAKRVAMHPNCTSRRYETLITFFPDELSNNPSYQLYVLEKGKPVEPRHYTEARFVSRAKADEVTEYECERYFPSDNTSVMREITSVSSFNPHKLQSLVFHPDLALRKRLAARPDLTEFIVEALMSDPATGVRNIITNNKNIKRATKRPVLQASELLIDPYKPAPEGVNLDELKPAQLAKLMRRGEASFVRQYVSHKSVIVRRAVANGDNTDKETLGLLLADTDYQVIINASTRLWSMYKVNIEDSLPSMQYELLLQEIEKHLNDSSNIPDHFIEFIKILAKQVSSAKALDLFKAKYIEYLQEDTKYRVTNIDTRIYWFPKDEFTRNPNLDDTFKIKALKACPHLVLNNLTVKQMTVEVLRELLIVLIPAYGVWHASVSRYIGQYPSIAAQLSNDDWKHFESLTCEKEWSSAANMRAALRKARYTVL